MTDLPPIPPTEPLDGSPPLVGRDPAKPATNTLAIVSLVGGLAAWMPFPIFGALVAVVTGHLALSQIRRTGEEGRELALAGLVLGYAHLALTALVLLVLALVFSGAIWAAIFASH